MNKNISTISFCSIFIFSYNLQASDFNTNSPQLPDNYQLTPRRTHVLIARHTHGYGTPCFNNHCGAAPKVLSSYEHLENQPSRQTNPTTSFLSDIIATTQKPT